MASLCKFLDINHTTDQIASTTDQIASTTDQIASTTDQIASTTDQTNTMAYRVSQMSSDQMDAFIKSKIDPLYPHPPTKENCEIWYRNYQTMPVTRKPLIIGSTLWYYWAYYTKQFCGIDYTHCHGKRNSLKWFQDGLGIYMNNEMRLCDTCNKYSVCAYIRHNNDGNINCVFCKRKATIMFCCMICNSMPNTIKNVNDQRIDKLLSSYHSQLKKNKVFYKRR